MAKKYVFIRIHKDVYGQYKKVRDNMERDINNFTGKRYKLPMTNVFKAIISPEYNERFIQIDLNKLSGLAQKRKKTNE